MTEEEKLKREIFDRVVDERSKRLNEEKKQKEIENPEKSRGYENDFFTKRKQPVQCHLWKKDVLVDNDFSSYLEVVHIFFQDSHESRTIVRCSECGQLYLKDFYEEVDWVDGDDPQYWTYIPVDSKEEAEVLNKKNRFELQSVIPKLNRDYPKGEPSRVYWVRKINTTTDSIQEKKYPYIVVRIFSAVYKRIDYPSSSTKEFLIQEALRITQEKKFRACVVWGPQESIYVELDGSVNVKEEAPSGGIAGL